MKITVEDFIETHKGQGSIEEQGINQRVSLKDAIISLEENDQKEIMNIVKTDPILNMYYLSENLFVSAKQFEKSKEAYKNALDESALCDLELITQLVDQVFDKKESLAEAIIGNLKPFINISKEGVDSATQYNTELAKLATGKKSKLVINIVPKLKFENNVLTRIDLFRTDKDDERIELCPRNNNEKISILARGIDELSKGEKETQVQNIVKEVIISPIEDVYSHFAHEATHDQDFDRTSGQYKSAEVVDNVISRHYKNNIEKRKEIPRILTEIAKNINKHFKQYYKFDDVIKRDGGVNKNAVFHAELTGFFSEEIYKKVYLSSVQRKDFNQEFKNFSQKVINSVNEEDRAFVADLLHSCTEDLFRTLKKIPEVQQAGKILEELKKEQLTNRQQQGQIGTNMTNTMGVINTTQQLYQQQPYQQQPYQQQPYQQQPYQQQPYQQQPYQPQLYQQQYQQGNNQNQQLGQELTQYLSQLPTEAAQNDRINQLVNQLGQVRHDLYRSPQNIQQLAQNQIQAALAQLPQNQVLQQLANPQQQVQQMEGGEVSQSEQRRRRIQGNRNKEEIEISKKRIGVEKEIKTLNNEKTQIDFVQAVNTSKSEVDKAEVKMIEKSRTNATAQNRQEQKQGLTMAEIKRSFSANDLNDLQKISKMFYNAGVKAAKTQGHDSYTPQIKTRSQKRNIEKGIN